MSARAGAGLGIPADMRRCALCSTGLWSWWSDDAGHAFCTDCALVVSARRDSRLRAAAGGRR